MSLREEALATLTAWSAPSAEQERLRGRYVAHLAAHADAASRACRPDHLTASTLVLSHDATAVLLTLHTKARRWFQLGGHCEPDDATLLAAAAREAREESGIADLRFDPEPVQLSEHEVPFCRGPSPGRLVHHLDVRFVATAPPDVRASVSAESIDVRWWPVDDLPEAELSELVQLALERRTSSN